MGRGQIWSMDLVVGVLIFLVAIGVIVSLVNRGERTDTTTLTLESEVVATKLTSDPDVQVTAGDQLDMDALLELAVMDYATLKSEFGITDDVCIYLTDEEGNLVYITDGTTKYTGIGANSDEFNLSAGYDGSGNEILRPCGKPCDADECLPEP